MDDKSAILAALRANDGNVSKAARSLSVARRTLQNRMRATGLPEGRSGRRPRKLSYHSSGIGVGWLIGLVAAGLVGTALVRKVPGG